MDYTEARDKLEDEIAQLVMVAERRGLKQPEIVKILYAIARAYDYSSKPLTRQLKR